MQGTQPTWAVLSETMTSTTTLLRPLLLSLVVMFSASICFGQDLVIYGLVKDLETLKKMQGVTVIVLQNGNQFDAIQTSANGKYEFELPLGYQYDLKFTKPGFVSKTIRMNTQGIPDEDRHGGFQMDAAMTLFAMVEGFDTSITDEPIGRASFDQQKNSIEFDFGYTADRQKLIDNELKRLEDLAKNMEKMKAKFEELLRKGDGKMDTEKFEDALGLFNQALEIFPQDETALAKRDAAQAKVDELNAAAERQAKYESLMSQGNSQFKSADYAAAKASFQEALEVLPDEREPRDRIAECDEKLAALASRESYDQLIEEADQLFASEDYALSIDKYNEALAILPDEKRPRDQIKEAQARLDALLDEAARLAEMEKRYEEQMSLGKNNLKSKDYTLALNNYREASSIFPDRQPPKDKIAEIEQILKDLESEAAANAEADAAAAERERIEREYQALISKADQQFDNEALEGALTDYEAALELKPNEKYPKSRIQRIQELLDRAAADLLADQEKQAEEDARLAAEEEARLAAEERERLAEEERSRRAEEERLARLAEEEERRKREEEERLRRERALNNIDSEKELEVDQYFREAKSAEEKARMERVQQKKDGQENLQATGEERSRDARDEEARQRDIRAEQMASIQREGQQVLADHQRTSSRDKESHADNMAEEQVQDRRSRSQKEMDIRENERRYLSKQDEEDEREVRLNAFNRDTDKALETNQRYVERSNSLRQDKEYDVRQDEASQERLVKRGGQVHGQSVNTHNKEALNIERYYEDVTTAANERRSYRTEDTVQEKEKHEAIGADKKELTVQAQADIQRKKASQDNLQAERSMKAESRAYDRRQELFDKNAGGPKDNSEFIQQEGTGDLPEGVSEKSYELGNKIVIERTVKTGNKVDRYRKVVSKAGTYYFKNDQSITAQAWREETLQVQD